jgi:hypothetical protein
MIVIAAPSRYRCSARPDAIGSGRIRCCPPGGRDASLGRHSDLATWTVSGQSRPPVLVVPLSDSSHPVHRSPSHARRDINDHREGWWTLLAWRRHAGGLHRLRLQRLDPARRSRAQRSNRNRRRSSPVCNKPARSEHPGMSAVLFMSVGRIQARTQERPDHR